MKRTLIWLFAAAVMLTLAACGGKETSAPPEEPAASAETPAAAAEEPIETPAETPAAAAEESIETPEAAVEEPEESAPPRPLESGILVAYFSATGTTRGVAERLAEAVGADLYEIVPAEPYSAADLNYNDSSSRSTREQNDKSVRPEIAGESLSLDGYTTIYVGFPIWWGEEPRILDTFIESYDFTGKTMIPFCTSASSGIGSSGKNMEKLTDGALWLDGKRFGGSVGADELRAWADGLQ